MTYLSNIALKKISKAPKKIATTIENTITIIVSLMVRSLLGQFTFFASVLASFKKVISLGTGFVILFKNRPAGHISSVARIFSMSSASLDVKIFHCLCMGLDKFFPW